MHYSCFLVAKELFFMLEAFMIHKLSRCLLLSFLKEEITKFSWFLQHKHLGYILLQFVAPQLFPLPSNVH